MSTPTIRGLRNAALTCLILGIASCSASSGASTSPNNNGSTSFVIDPSPITVGLGESIPVLCQVFPVNSGFSSAMSLSLTKGIDSPAIIAAGGATPGMQNGTITGYKIGTDVLNCISGAVSFVGTAPVTVVGYTLTASPLPLTLNVGQSKDVTIAITDRHGAAVSAANMTFSWSSNPAIAKADPIGLTGGLSATVSGIASGTTSITVDARVGSALVGSTSFPVTVVAPALTITSDSAHITVQQGSGIGVPIHVKNAQGVTINNATVTVASSSGFTTTASGTAVAIQGLVAGNYNMVITATDPVTGAVATLTIPVTVTAGPPQTAQLVAPATGATVGGTLQLTGVEPGGAPKQFSVVLASLRAGNVSSPANALATGFTSTSTAVATVTASGVVTGVAAGTTTINAQWSTGGTDYNASVTLPVGTLDTSTPSGISLSTLPGLSNSVAVGKVTAYRCTATNGSTQVIANTVWTSSNTAVATVTSAGIVTGVSAGTATITCNINSRTTTMPTTVTP